MTSRISSHRIGIVATALLLLGATHGAWAGMAFFAGKMADGVFIPDPGAKGPLYAVPFGQVTTRVDGAVARTSVRESLVGPETAASGVCIIALPQGARDNLVVSSGPPRGTLAAIGGAKYLAPTEAQKVLEAIARGADATPLLALSGRPIVLIETMSLCGRLDVQVEFEQTVRTVQGISMVDCPLPMTGFARGPSRISVSAAIKSDKPLRAVFSPTHEVALERKGLFEVAATTKAQNWRGGEDFRLCFVADNDPLGLRVLAYREAGEADGYFMIVGNPTGDARGEKPIDKDVTFVLDTSGSMRGEKIEQARAAIDYCLTRLNAGDRFNIITFGTTVRMFRDQLVANEPHVIKAARQFIDQTVAQGNTNIGEALARGLVGASEAGRLRIMIFLTDGTPTAGELSADRIVQQCASNNTGAMHIFVMGVGQDVNAHLLDKLAEQTDGSSEYVVDDETIDVKVAALYDRLSNPVLGAVAVDFGELRTHSFYPKKLSALFRGGEVMIFGRYREGGPQIIKLTGELAGKKLSYECWAEFPKEPAGRETEFVAPLWAARKIGFLLQEIRLHKDNKELVEAVIALSQRYGIVTEYTEFLSYGNAPAAPAAAMAEARHRMVTANAQQSGQWAVNQAFNEKQMQNRMVAGDGANVYRDRRGQTVAAQTIRQIGNRVYYLRSGQWADAEEAGKRATRTVKLYSPEYFELVKTSPDFARAQALGWAVQMNVGDQRIVIEKDGRTQDEELKKQAVQEVIPQQQEMMQQNNLQQQIPQQFNNVRNNPIPQQNQRVQPPNELLQKNRQPQPQD